MGAVRNAISLGGDADTMACIAGGIAQAFYGSVPEPIAGEVRTRLPDGFLDVLDRFEYRYGSVIAVSDGGWDAWEGTALLLRLFSRESDEE